MLNSRSWSSAWVEYYNQGRESAFLLRPGPHLIQMRLVFCICFHSSSNKTRSRNIFLVMIPRKFWAGHSFNSHSLYLKMYMRTRKWWHIIFEFLFVGVRPYFLNHHGAVRNRGPWSVQLEQAWRLTRNAGYSLADLPVTCSKNFRFLYFFGMWDIFMKHCPGTG